MREAVIVSTARTPIGKAYRGAFNATSGPTLGGHAIGEAVKRSGVDPKEIDDVVMGCAMQMGTTGRNIARNSLIRAGLPDTVAGMSMDRQCASGMMAIATAAKQIITDGMNVTVGGGLESISLVQTDKMTKNWDVDAWIMANKPDLYMSMLETAEVVADRYGISRERQDEYAAQSQARTHAAQQAGRFDAEIVPLPSTMKFMNKETGEVQDIDVTLKWWLIAMASAASARTNTPPSRRPAPMRPSRPAGSTPRSCLCPRP